MRFRLATLLTFVTFIAITVALSWQIVTLRQEVSQLQEEVQRFSGTRTQAVWRAKYNQHVTPIGVPYSVEEAMMMDQQRAPLPRR